MDVALVPCKEQCNASELLALGSLGAVPISSGITFCDSTSFLDRLDPNLWLLGTSRLAGNHKRMAPLLTTSTLPILRLLVVVTTTVGHPERATRLGNLTWEERQIGTGALERVEKRGFVDD